MLLPTGRPTSPAGLSATPPENPQPPQDGQDVTLGNGRRVSVSSAPPSSPDPCGDLGAFFDMAEQSGGHGQNPQEVLQGATGGPAPEQQNETQWGIYQHGHHHHHSRHRHHHTHHSHQRQHTHPSNPEERIIVETDDGQTNEMTKEEFERKYNPDDRVRSQINFIYHLDSNGAMHATAQSRFNREHAGSNITETG